MKRFLCLTLAVSLMAIFIPAGVSAGEGGSADSGSEFIIREGAEYAPGEILVKFKRNAGGSAVGNLRKAAGQLSAETVGHRDVELLKVSGDLEKAITALRSSGLVEYAEPNYKRRMDAWPADPPNDPIYTANQWNFKSYSIFGGINMPNAWPVEIGDPGVVVAILDTGVAYKTSGVFTQAPDLAGTSFVDGRDFANGDSFAADDQGHGTHVCGTIAQTTNNGIGAAGVAPGCTIMPVKVLDEEGSGYDEWIISGLEYAADHGASVINMSLSGPDTSDALEEGVNYAFSQGVVVCASSGNDDNNMVGYPAAYSSCMAVGSSNRNKERASYSNYGNALDVVAPGGDDDYGITQQTFTTESPSTYGNFGFMSYIGTSMACPHAVGVAALVKSAHPSWTALQVRGVVASTCNDINGTGWDEFTGWGLIDAQAALSATDANFPQPAIAGISPAHGRAESFVEVTITGTGLDGENNIMLRRRGETPVGATSVSVPSATEVSCEFDLSGVQPGLWDLYIGNTGLLEDTVAGGFEVDPSGNHTWYLAEGSTNYGFEEFVLLQNPNDRPVNAQLTFMTQSGARSPYPVTIPAGSRVTVRVNDVVPNTDVSTKVDADGDIVCERSMYWASRIEGTDSIGIQAPSYTWYLAEGSTDYGFDTFLLIQNPNNQRTQVYITYMTPEGPLEREPLLISANSRYSINVKDELPSEDMSFMVQADRRVIAERSMYWNGNRGGHDSIGTTSPCENWYLAEGTTDWGYDEYVLIQNPNDVDARVQITYMTTDGPVPQNARTIPANSRVTVHVDEDLPKDDLSVQVAGDMGIVVERAMYWDNGTGKGGHCSIGVPQPREECLLAEGTTNWGFDEWILVQNPNDTKANVSIEYMTSEGLKGRPDFIIEPNSRVTIHVNSDLSPIDTSARVYSNLPIIAERSMYWHNKGGGHVSQGLMR